MVFDSKSAVAGQRAIDTPIFAARTYFRVISWTYVTIMMFATFRG